MKFKSILAWIKSHLGIVLASLVVLVSIPAAYVGSEMWMKKTVSEVTKKGQAELSKVESLKVEYSVPQVDPSVQTVSVKHEPNAKLTEAFAAQRAAVLAQQEQVVSGYVAFNNGTGPAAREVGRSEHTPLVDGLFPAVALSDAQKGDARQAEDATRAKLNEFEDALLGKRGRTSPYQQMLESVRAGGPLEAQQVADVMREAARRYQEQVTSGSRQLTDEEEAQLKTLLLERRMAAYQGRASQISMYASMDSFDRPRVSEDGARGPSSGRDGEGEKFRTIPVGPSIPNTDLTVPKMFLNQWDVWTKRDIFAALALANRGPDGALLPVDKAPVKRVLKVRLYEIDDMKSLDPSPVDPSGAGELIEATAPTAPTGGTQGFEPIDPSRSITGHVRGGWNKTYEVRRAQVEIMVASDRLPEVLAAFPRTNLMTVTGCSVSYIDTWADLRDGYFYGDEHVVRATIQIESLWLKSWLLPLMPEDVQKALWMEVAQPQ